MMGQHQLPVATLRWQGTTAVSEEFGDVYFDRDDARGESQYVFVDANALTSRWQTADSSAFTILETGFGTGLNFLITLNNWIRTSHQRTRLNYIAVEGRPLRHADVQRLLGPYLDLPGCAWLLDRWPLPVRGVTHLVNDALGVDLFLLLDDIDAALDQFVTTAPCVDAVYLDGFAPAKNPAMWQRATLGRVAQLCRSSTSFSTFTAAGHVRRTLEGLGCDVKRQPGFGHKREMLLGQFADSTSRTRSQRAWTHTRARPTPGRVAVVGAGLAGSAVAYALARRGVETHLICAEQRPPASPSCNPQAAWFPAITSDLTPRTRLLWHAVNALQQYLGNHPDVNHLANGALFLATEDTLIHRYQRCADSLRAIGFDVTWLTAHEAHAYCGIPVSHPGLAIADAGVVDSEALCRSWQTHALIRLHRDLPIASVNRENGIWHLNACNSPSTQGSSTITADTLVVATGPGNLLGQTPWQSACQHIYGSVSHLSSMATLSNQERLLCYGGFVTPPLPDHPHHSVGATWHTERTDITDTGEARAAHSHNIQSLNEVVKTPFDFSREEAVNGLFSGVRVTTSDRLPVAGPVAGQLTDAGLTVDETDTTFEQLYISTGHGSRGATTSLLCGEVIASLICREPLPVSQRIYEAIHPMRFRQRTKNHNDIRSSVKRKS